MSQPERTTNKPVTKNTANNPSQTNAAPPNLANSNQASRDIAASIVGKVPFIQESDSDPTVIEGKDAKESKLAPAPDRLKAWLDAVDVRNMDIIPFKDPVKNVPLALKSFGAGPFKEMIEIDQSSTNYEANSAGPSGASADAPKHGGRFKNAFAKDGAEYVALMMENYRAGKEKYTASDAFLVQWGAVHQVLGSDQTDKNEIKNEIKIKNEMKRIIADLKAKEAQEAWKYYTAWLPATLPKSIYRQNISSDKAKEVLEKIFEKQTYELTADDLEEVLTETPNGKSTRNIVKTFNEVTGQAYRITGGALRRNAGNFQLRFDIGKET
jgi:hypothetical protein